MQYVRESSYPKGTIHIYGLDYIGGDGSILLMLPFQMGA